MGRILHMARKEFIQVFRDPRMAGIVFIAPVMQLFLFGYAVTTDVHNISLGVMDRDGTPESRELVRSILNSGYFVAAGALESDDAIRRSLVDGAVDVALIIPRGYGKSVALGRQAQVQILLDGGQSNSAVVAMGYLGKIFAVRGLSAAAERVNALAPKFGGATPSLPIVTAETRVRFNPELRSAWYMVPGVLGMIMMIMTMLMTSLAITREREVGTMEQLVVTPIKPWQILGGKMTPFAIIGLIDVTLILIVGMGHFGLPMNGSFALLYFAALVFLFTTLGMGLMLSTLSHTQQQAMFVAFMVMLPSVLLSGFMFPIANMPEPIQYLTYANPLRYFLEIVRSIILKGSGWDVLAPQFGMLFLLGVILFSVASFRFRKTAQ
jgi:ABC-2 type transport system permease protein